MTTRAPNFLSHSFKQDLASRKSCYFRRRVSCFEIKETKKDFNHLEFRWCVFHCVVAVSKEYKERNLKDRHHKERDHGSYSKQAAKTGKYGS